MVRGIIFHIAAMSTNATHDAQHALQGGRGFLLPSAKPASNPAPAAAQGNLPCHHAHLQGTACIPVQRTYAPDRP